MKTYRTVLLTLIAIGGLAALAPLANAQENAPKGRPGRPGMPGGGSIQERVKQMTEQLNLTDEQKEKFKAAFQEQGEKMRALREDQNLSPEEKRTKFRELLEGLEAKTKPILTPEQQGKWQKLRAQGGGLGGQQMAKELNLTDEQKEKLKSALADQAEKFKELRENQNLSREEKMAKLREMNEGIEAKLKPILTPEQFEKWQKVRPQPGAPRRRPAGDN